MNARRLLVGSVILPVTLAVVLAGCGLGSSIAPVDSSSAPRSLGRCPWVRESLLHTATPQRLAAQVVARMTLAEKVGLVELVRTLRAHGPHLHTAVVAWANGS